MPVASWRVWSNFYHWKRWSRKWKRRKQFWQAPKVWAICLCRASEDCQSDWKLTEPLDVAVSSNGLDVLKLAKRELQVQWRALKPERSYLYCSHVFGWINHCLHNWKNETAQLTWSRLPPWAWWLSCGRLDVNVLCNGSACLQERVRLKPRVETLESNAPMRGQELDVVLQTVWSLKSWVVSSEGHASTTESQSCVMGDQ